MTDDEALEEGQRRIWHMLDLVGDHDLMIREVECLTDGEARALLMTAVSMLYALDAPRRPIL